MDAYLWNLYSWKIKHVGFECVLFFVEFVRCNSFIQTNRELMTLVEAQAVTMLILLLILLA